MCLNAGLPVNDVDAVCRDELGAAIHLAEEKRRELEAQHPGYAVSAQLLTALPKAAEMYRRQVELGPDGDELAAQKARLF